MMSKKSQKKSKKMQSRKGSIRSRKSVMSNFRLGTPKKSVMMPKVMITELKNPLETPKKSNNDPHDLNLLNVKNFKLNSKKSHRSISVSRKNKMKHRHSVVASSQNKSLNSPNMKKLKEFKSSLNV